MAQSRHSQSTAALRPGNYAPASVPLHGAPSVAIMTIDLHYILASGPCRSVMLTAKAIGVELNLKPCDLFSGEHLKPEFIKMNPQHTVPTLDDNGFYLSESRAIMEYLVDQYAKNDSLYPKDAKKRAVVTQRLYFDMGTLYQRLIYYYLPVMLDKASPDPEKLKKLHEALGFLNTILNGQDWVAGSSFTIADITLVSTVSTAESVGVDVSEYKNVTRWFEKCKKSIAGYNEINHKGCLQLKEIYNNALKK
ncbi:glutathione S-transferase 1-1-like [Bacillus rossius redtenbacheri]|uniref:glutathione S-transferase 1-1-like n=1 Tax=Bacillus rossius redtenbacheri TaxID=93214 RepID=UPI002FDD89E6